MNDSQIKLVIGSLLHDMGKIVYRSGDGRNHSQSGYEYLKGTEMGRFGEILDCVRYHHGSALAHAKLEKDSLAYITYFADNVAAAMDRREALDTEDGFDKTVPLASVFNILNGNHGRQHYGHHVMNPRGEMIFPSDKETQMDASFYSTVTDRISDNLKGVEISGEYINSLLAVLEANLIYIPSSTSRREQADISLYDHVKMTAAVAEAMYQYLEQAGIHDYEAYFLKERDMAWKENMFLLYSMDVSGIQKFIYTINSKGALRGLRARSFYLELLMEHVIDELLQALSLSRASLIYSGGGHCYLLLPNTEQAKEILSRQQEIVNHWFMDHFGTGLYIAGGFAPCSASNLKNEPEGSYEAMFLAVSEQTARQKSHRYTAGEIRLLNRGQKRGQRECSICRRMEPLDKNDRCPVCAALENLSKDVLYQDYFAVMTEKLPGSLPLPGEKYLVSGNKKALLGWMEKDSYVRSYTINDVYTGKEIATKLWVGNYTTGDTFDSFAEKADGIERIAVLRADVDNLGNTFVNGFKREKEGGRYETLSRTATLSRQLSLFFKCYINKILAEGKSHAVCGRPERNISIVYSGGDDIFLTGSWNDVVDAFVDIRNALERFTQGTLTISGGIRIYGSGYPISRMAEETAELEDISKKGQKNAVTLFDKYGRYDWDVFVNQVLGEKYQVIQSYFTVTKNHGKAFLYHLLELLREREEKVRFNRARFVYFLSRMEPEKDDAEIEWEAYREFSGKMYDWVSSEENRRQLVTAIYLYVYLNREREGKKQDVD